MLRVWDHNSEPDKTIFQTRIKLSYIPDSEAVAAEAPSGTEVTGISTTKEEPAVTVSEAFAAAVGSEGGAGGGRTGSIVRLTQPLLKRSDK
jgi:hypothetical protein